MKIEIGKWYYITPKVDCPLIFEEGSYFVVEIRKIASLTEPQQSCFGIELQGNIVYFPILAFDFVPILSTEDSPDYLPIPVMSLNTDDLNKLFKFSTRSGFTLPETYFFFVGEALFNYPAISDKTRGLYKDMLKKKLARENSVDREDRKLYDILITSLEMLVMNSLDTDLSAVPEVQTIKEEHQRKLDEVAKELLCILKPEEKIEISKMGNI